MCAPERDYLAEMIDRKGRLSLAEASVVLTPLSMIMPAWGEGTFGDTRASLQPGPHLTPSRSAHSCRLQENQLCSQDVLKEVGGLW